MRTAFEPDDLFQEFAWEMQFHDSMAEVESGAAILKVLYVPCGTAVIELIPVRDDEC